MRKALLFVIVVAMVATGPVAVRGRAVFRERNQHLVRCQWRLADRFGWRRLWRDFVAPFLGSKKFE